MDTSFIWVINMDTIIHLVDHKGLIYLFARRSGNQNVPKRGERVDTDNRRGCRHVVMCGWPKQWYQFQYSDSVDVIEYNNQ